MMDRIYNLENCNIKVSLHDGIIRVFSNAELWRFLAGKANERFTSLVQTIKIDYENQYQKKLQISNNSLVVEILVHVYCDYIGLKFNNLIKFKPLNNIVNKLLVRAEIVDCGEKDKDSNRWVWDFLSKFKPIFIKILPQNLNRNNLKVH